MRPKDIPNIVTLYEGVLVLAHRYVRMGIKINNMSIRIILFNNNTNVVLIGR